MELIFEYKNIFGLYIVVCNLCKNLIKQNILTKNKKKIYTCAYKCYFMCVLGCGITAQNPGEKNPNKGMSIKVLLMLLMLLIKKFGNLHCLSYCIVGMPNHF